MNVSGPNGCPSRFHVCAAQLSGPLITAHWVAWERRPAAAPLRHVDPPESGLHLPSAAYAFSELPLLAGYNMAHLS